MRTKNKNTPSTIPTEATSRALTLARLPSAQLRRLARPHTGYEQFVELFAKLVAEHGDELGTGLDIEAMRSSIRNVQSLAPARQAAADAFARAAEQLALVEDTQAVEESKAWKEMLLCYGRSRQAARTNDQIEVSIEPFVRFMKQRPRAKTTPATPK